MQREAALSRPSRNFKAGASERSPPLWPGINAALTLQGDADRFTWEARWQGSIGFELFQV